MRVISRSLLVCVLGVVLGGFSQAVVVAAAESHGEEALQGGSLLGAPLVVSSTDRLFLGGAESQAAREATRSNPVAVAARQASRTSFEGFAPGQAANEAKSAFPGLIEQPAGGAPQLPAGQRIVGYATDNAAQVSLPGGAIGVIESLEPIAARTAHGHHAPLDLRLKEADGGSNFQPARSDVGVDVPKDLSNGVSLSGTGVSLTPVDGHGLPLAGSEGALDGSAVVWGDAEGGAAGVHDLATLAKPSPEGFDLTSMLLSQRSPGELYFRVGMPSGARLESVEGESARVVKDGVTLAIVSPVSAEDAEGSDVPVSMDVHGEIITLMVDLSGDYLYPIVVDPEVNDGQLATTSGGKRSNWVFETNASFRFTGSAVYEGVGKEHLEAKGISEYQPGEVAFWGYQTHGNSKVYELKTETSAKNKSAKIESFLEFEEPGGAQETKKILSTELAEPEYEKKVSVLCAANSSKVEECLPAAGKEHNAVHFQQSPTAKPGSNYKFSDTMSQGIVSISEPAGTHSTTSFNTTSSELELEVENETKEKEKIKRANALYGAGSWLTKFKGALEGVAKDPGIGVAATKLEYESSAGKWEQLYEHNYLENENACQGVQCYETHGEVSTLNSKLPDGEDKIRYSAKEAMSGTESLSTEGQATVKVDTSAPHAIELEGLPYGNELSEKPYELTVEATDGEGTIVASSGIKGIEVKGTETKKGIVLLVDGSEATEVGKQTGCSVAKGACTASAKWTVNGAELGAGHHSIQVVAVDNAGNEGRLPGGGTQISIRHSTPVALGPGSVDLQSGDFSLGASDVSLGSGLTVGRNYSSRALEAGVEGPLGPQWSLSLGNTESLVEMIDGGVLMTAANGSQTIFAPIFGEKGKFESPTGDSNLTLTLEENKETKQKLAYYLEDAADHTKTKFTLPGGTKAWMPTKQEGTVAADTITYAYQTTPWHEENEYALPKGSEPAAVTRGPDDDLWFTDAATNMIGKITRSGTVTEYALPSGSDPRGITYGPDGNLWYADRGDGKIGRITTSGTITEYSLSSETSEPTGITGGPDGKLWFTEYNASKIGKITTSGTITEYVLPKLSGPFKITQGADGDMWFTESEVEKSKIGKITTSGVVTEYSLPTESIVDDITQGPDGNLWFTDSFTSKVGKITTSGAITEYSLPSRSEPGGITTGPDGELWFTEGGEGNSGIGKITTMGTITESSLPKESYPRAITSDADGDVWYADTGTSKIGKIAQGTITQPSETLAPAPAGVSCTPELKPGCRALKFIYATTTDAIGEAEGEWGAYNGRLMQVRFEAYNSASKKMQRVMVAEYSYDKQGRLRAEWDPRVLPALKTTYGYDQEGHVTALTASGQESWAFTYGSIAGDSGTGRLLKAAQAPASTELWKGEQVANTEAPTITGAATEGVRLLVSNGKWSGSPTAYGYQWESCDTSGGACKPISGATNENYTLQPGDVGRTVLAAVTAMNGDGAVSVASAATAVVQAVGSAPQFTEYALPAGSGPTGITAGPTGDGNVWFAAEASGKMDMVKPDGTITEYKAKTPTADMTNAGGNLWYGGGVLKCMIGEMTTSGTMTEYGLPGCSMPEGLKAGPDGKVWFTEFGTSKIGKITTSGTVTEYALPAGSKPFGITLGPDGNLWYTDRGTSKVGKITTSGVITEYALPAGSEPYRIAAGPDGNLWFADYGSSKIGKITTSGTVTEYALPAGSKPFGIAAGPDGNLWYTDSGSSKIGKITTSGTVTEYALPAGSEPDGIALGPDGYLWYTDHATNKVGEIGPTVGEYEAPRPGLTIDYNVPLEGSSAPHQMGVNATTHKPEPEQWGQADDPVEATAIFPSDEPQGWPASSYKRATTYYLDERGRTVNVARPSALSGGSIATTEYNELNDIVRTLSPDNRQTALGAGSKSAEVSKLLDTQSTYNGEGAKEGEVEEPGTRLIESFGPEHEVKYTPNGFPGRKESLARLHMKYFYDEGAPGGEKYDLVTETSQLAQLFNGEGKPEEEVEVRKTTTAYSGQSNLGWKLRAPTSVTDASESEGLKIKHTRLYNATTGQITETRGPEGGSGESAHDTRTIYYSAEANTEGFAACGSHPEWAGLVCETLPAKQPEGSGVPKLPVTSVTYNVWNEPLVTTETVGTTVRTKTETYDEAGRLTSSETTSTADTALPKVTNEYNSTSGVLEKQSTTVEGKTKTIASKYNTLGRMTEYTDSDGNTAKYKYGGPENDGLLEEVSDSSNEGHSNQTYSYDTTTKERTSLVDSAAGTFKASYDVEGNLSMVVYPYSICAGYTRNSVGEVTGVQYTKYSLCSGELPTWYSETRTPSVRGETFSRTNTLASENYSYDTLGRLTETQETPAGEGCKTRVYAYDEESNRTSLTSRSPGGEGKCATEGGTVEKHTYDEANRLTDTGIAYDSFGNVTKLPAADAEGHELSSTFYVDNAVATQSQNGVSSSYYLDPEGRVRETISGATTTIEHYDGPGEAVAWTSEGEGKFKRNIPGIDGALAATQTNSETPVIQLHDLQGDVVATIGDKSGETKLLSTYNSTEFGVPNGGKAPPTFAWLGAGDIASSLPSGVITYGATSYVPQTGRALQSEQVEPPGLSGGSGAGAAYTMQEEPWNMQGAAREGAEAPGLEAAREQAALEAAMRAAMAVEGPDPAGYLTDAQAKRAGEKLVQTAEGEEAYEVATFVLSLMDDAIDWLAENIAGEFINTGEMVEWTHKLGAKLLGCSNGRSDGLDWCWVHWKLQHVELPLVGSIVAFPEFGFVPEVEECATNLGYGFCRKIPHK